MSARNDGEKGRKHSFLPTCEVQRSSAGEDDQCARLGAHLRRAAHLRHDLETKNFAHIPAGHLRQHKRSGLGAPGDFPCVSPHARTHRPHLQHIAAPTISREEGQEGQAKCASGGKSALAFARRTRSSPRSFAVLPAS